MVEANVKKNQYRTTTVNCVQYIMSLVILIFFKQKGEAREATVFSNQNIWVQDEILNIAIIIKSKSMNVVTSRLDPVT